MCTTKITPTGEAPTVIATRKRKLRFLTEAEITENELQYKKVTRKLWLWVALTLLVIGVIISIVVNVITGIAVCGTIALMIWLISV